MRNLFCLTVALAVAACVACGGQPAPQAQSAVSAAPAKASEPQVTPEIQSAAESILGNEAEVLAEGDWAHTGRQQVLVINRLDRTSPGVGAGILLTRLTVIENDGTAWKQLLLCDEHLKNTHGFLGAAPVQSVTAWRLEFEQDAQKGLLLFLTPYRENPAPQVATVEVAWNSAVNRYQVLAGRSRRFAGEVENLENPQRELR